MEQEILEVEIAQRRYNGDFGIGSIFEYINTFILEGNLAKTTTVIEFCSDINGDRNQIIIDNIVKLDNISKNRVNEIINEIKINDEYKYKKSQGGFSPMSLSYEDVIINEEKYEVNADSNMLSELKQILKFSENNAIADKKYLKYKEKLMKKEEKKMKKKNTISHNEDDMII